MKQVDAYIYDVKINRPAGDERGFLEQWDGTALIVVGRSFVASMFRLMSKKCADLPPGGATWWGLDCSPASAETRPERGFCARPTVQTNLVKGFPFADTCGKPKMCVSAILPFGQSTVQTGNSGSANMVP